MDSEWINFRHLYSFWAVCRYGGFRKAAERIHVTQSTISEQVTLLEEYLEVRLLERSTRSVKVTDRGAALLDYADEVFSIGYQINHLFRDKHDSLMPSNMRIGMVGGISRNFLFRYISDVLTNRPGTHLELLDGSFDDLNRQLRDYRLDLVFSLERPRQKDMRALGFQRVFTSPLCIVGTPEVMERARSADTGGEPVEVYLFRHPFEGRPVQQLVAERLGSEVEVPVSTDDISLLRFLANGGRGLSVVPQIGVREDLDAGRVVQVPVGHDLGIEVYAIYLTRGVRRPLIEAFLGTE